MKVAIIIPTLNEASTIGGLVKSLVEEPYPDKEIIVVDGGSTDGTAEIAKRSGAIVLMERGKHKCLSNARNQGARETRAEILCFLDGDYVRVGQNFIKNAMGHFEDLDVIGVTCKKVVIEDTLASKVQGSVNVSPSNKFWSKKFSAASGHIYVKTRVHFLRKQIFEKMGGFQLGFGEDVILLQKLNDYMGKNPKKKVVVEQNSVFFTRRLSSFRRAFRRAVWCGRIIPGYIKKSKLSLRFKLVFWLVPSIYLFSLISIPLVLISPWFLIPALIYIAKLFLILYDSAISRNKYRLLTPVLDFVVSSGHTIGLLQYLSGKRALSHG